MLVTATDEGIEKPVTDNLNAKVLKVFQKLSYTDNEDETELPDDIDNNKVEEVNICTTHKLKVKILIFII